MKNDAILVTRSYLPPYKVYKSYLDKLWDSNYLTNNGPFAQELEKKLETYLGVKHVIFVANGTLALQIAIRSLDITKEIITTPFSFVATANAILWEHCKPVFVDIDPNTFCIDPLKIEQAITKNTQAILAVHVFGNACDVKAIEKIAKKHTLPIIYDAAHAFGTKIGQKSVMQFGDISTLSFHATKLFHTGEGGAIVTNSDELARKIRLYRSFGEEKKTYVQNGINAKNSEFHAALGLSNLPLVPTIIKKRKRIVKEYDKLLSTDSLTRQTVKQTVHSNGSYYPIVAQSEELLLTIIENLNKDNIYPRRYFNPSLNTLAHIQGESCPVSESVANRVLCLPLYHELSLALVKKIAQNVIKTIEEYAKEKQPKRYSVTVGIPVYNEAQNIDYLLTALMEQTNKRYVLQDIIVINDASTDHTVRLVQKIAKKYPIIRVIDDGLRLGKSKRLNQLYLVNRSEILVTLDGDIAFSSRTVIDNLVEKFDEKNVIAVSANKQPLPASTFIQQIVNTWHELWYEVRKNKNNGDNIYNIAASTLALRNTITKKLQFPFGTISDADYVYVFVKKMKGKFIPAKDAVIYYHNPATVRDFLLQVNRSAAGKQTTHADNTLYTIERTLLLKSMLKTFVKHPITLPLALCLVTYAKITKKQAREHKPGMWEIIGSTKKGFAKLST